MSGGVQRHGGRGGGARPGAKVRRGVSAIGSVCLGVALAACGHLVPSLETVYGEAQVMDSDQPPLVVVHGIFGSQLRDAHTGQAVWPPPDDWNRRSVSSSNVELLPAHAHALSEPGSQYALGGDLFRVLEEFGGYRRAEAGARPTGDGHPYYVFLYDWRQDSVEIARQFDSFLGEIRQAHGDPKTRVDVIAHGTGGLIVRYYLRYGTKDVTRNNDFAVSLAGSQYVRRVILLGTPNLGSVEMLRTVAVGNEIDGVSLTPDWAWQLPSLYQFFPHPISQPLLSAAGEPADLDHFDIETWVNNQWGPFTSPPFDRAHGNSSYRRPTMEKYLERARRFIWSLTVPTENPTVRYVVFGGACHRTPAKALLEADGGVLRLRFGSDAPSEHAADTELLLHEPGDGLVTKSSLLARQTFDPTIARHRYSDFPLLYAAFFCARHNQLERNYDLQNNLLNALLSADPT